MPQEHQLNNHMSQGWPTAASRCNRCCVSAYLYKAEAVKTRETLVENRAQNKTASIPIACPFADFVSSAVELTASKPIKLKNTIAAPPWCSETTGAKVPSSMDGQSMSISNEENNNEDFDDNRNRVNKGTLLNALTEHCYKSTMIKRKFKQADARKAKANRDLNKIRAADYRSHCAMRVKP